MSYSDEAGLGVNNHYGPRKTGNAMGIVKTEGIENEMAIEVTGDMLNNSFRPELYLPARSRVISAYANVTEVFALGGTSPTINIGTATSEGTNGVEISKTQAEALGTYTLSLAGTWAAAIGAADTLVGVDMDGTSPTATSAGKMRVVIKYIKL